MPTAESEAQDLRDQIKARDAQLAETQAELARAYEEIERLKGLNEAMCKQVDDHQNALGKMYTERDQNALRLRDAERKLALKGARGA